jgi:RHS repeat-associated protein
MKIGKLAPIWFAGVISFGFSSFISADTAGSVQNNDTEIAVMLPEDYISDVPFEKIGIASLKVSLEFKDINIPGPNGLDLTVNRMYNGSRVYPVAGFGDGWHLGLPFITVDRRQDTTAPLTNLGCIGDIYFVKFIFNNTYVYPVGFEKKNQLKAGTLAAFPDNSILLCEDGNPVHISTAGVKTVFGRYDGAVNAATAYRPTKIIDLFGNYINYTYQEFTHPTLGYQYQALQSMQRNDGAKVEFEYEIIDGRPWIKRASYLDRDMQYNHGGGLRAWLEGVTDQEGQITHFGYNTLGQIWTVKQPQGLEVTYGWRGPCSSDTALNCLNLHRKDISGPGIENRTLYYIWSFPHQTVVTENEFDSVQERIEKYDFYRFRPSESPLGGLVNKIEVFQNDSKILLVESGYQSSAHGEVGCPRRVISGSKTYVFQPRNNYCNRVTKNYQKVSVFNNSGTDIYVNNTINSDIYGNPLNRSLSNTSTFDEKHIKYTWYHDLTNWVVSQSASESVSTDSDIYLRTYKELYRSEYYTPASAQKSALKNKLFSGRLTDTYFYHANGDVKRHEKGTPQRWIEYSNYKNGTAQKILAPDRYNTSLKAFAYKAVNDDGTVANETNFNGVKVNYEYDKRGLLTKKSYEDNSNAEELTDYTFTGKQLKSLISKGNYRKETKFDAFIRPIMIEEWDVNDPKTARYISQRYNHKGQISFRAFPSTLADNTQGFLFEYDGLQRIKRHYENVSETGTSWHYLPGNKVKIIDAKGNATTTTYRAFGVPEYQKVKRIEQPEAVTTDIVYNEFDNPITVTQGGYTESRIYDTKQNLCRLARPDVGTTVFSYKTTGELDWFAEGVSGASSVCDVAKAPVSARVIHSYDNRGDLHQVTYPDSTPSKVSVLDAGGNLLSLTAGSAIWDYEYNSQGQTDKEILTLDNVSWLVDPEYNELGHLTNLTYPSGKVIAFAPNAFGQPTKAGDYAHTVKYHPMGGVSSFNYGNGLEFSQTLDDLQRPDLLTVKKANISLIGLDHSYDDNSNLSGILDLITASKNVSLDYDGLNRLETATGFWGAGSFEYDVLGNIETKTLGSESLTYTYNTSNRLTGITGNLSRNFGYDSRGNITSNGQRAFNFNLANQLITSGTNSYQCDGYNRRVKKVSNGKTQYSLYNAAGQLIMTSGDSGLTEYFYLGSKLIAKESQVATSEDTPGYTGHLEDDDLQLTYMQQRYYDPLIGRFYSNDPVGFKVSNPMSFNRYSYVNNSPYMYTDPDGRDGKIIREFLFIAPSSMSGLPEMFGYTNAAEGNKDLEKKTAALTSKVENAISPFPELGTVEYGLTLEAAFGPAGLVSMGIAFDSNGDSALNVSLGGGGGTPDASFSGYASWTNAASVSNLRGFSGITSIAALTGSISIITGDGYTGYSGALGGSLAPASTSAIITHTWQPFSTVD